MRNKKRYGIIYVLMFLFSCIYIIVNKGSVVNAKHSLHSNDLFFYEEITIKDSDGNITSHYAKIIGIVENADKDITTLTIPANIDGVPVGVVGHDENSYELDNANNFYKYNNIKTLIIEDGISKIDVGAFRNCSNLENVTLPKSLISIERRAFEGCSKLASVVFPDNLVSIGPDAFYNCKSLKQITIPASVVDIEDSDGGDYYSNPFRGCSGLTSISVDPNNAVFYSSEGENNYNAIIYKYGEVLYVGCSNTLIPSTIKSIGVGAFYGCSGLTSIEIPNSVTSIGYDAFYGCNGLTSITIPESVTSISGAFGGCDGLTSIAVAEENKVYDSRDNCNAIIKTADNSLILGCKKTIIPESVTSIVGAFNGCSSLTSMTIPDSITNIGNAAFKDCSGLTNIEIPDGVTNIGDRAFEGCSGLTNIKIPDGVTNIGDRAFEGCSGLTNIKIPDGVTNIGNVAFKDCSGLTNIEIPDSVTNIGSGVFKGCSGLTSIEIPNGVTSITSGYLFVGCDNLASITVAEGNTVYDSRDNCNAIIKTADNSLIRGCKNTKIPNSVTNIGENAFYGCNGLTSIEIPDSVTNIEDSAFCRCSSLVSIIIPGSVTNIDGVDLFYKCESLKTIYTDEGSYVDNWAKEHGYTVKYIGASDDPSDTTTDKPTDTQTDDSSKTTTDTKTDSSNNNENANGTTGSNTGTTPTTTETPATTEAPATTETVSTTPATTETPNDNLTTFNIKNKKTYKKSQKIKIKDEDGIKSVVLNTKKIKAKKGKKSVSFKLSSYKKSLKKKNKWNKIIVTDVNGNQNTIQFKIK